MRKPEFKRSSCYNTLTELKILMLHPLEEENLIRQFVRVMNFCQKTIYLIRRYEEAECNYLNQHLATNQQVKLLFSNFPISSRNSVKLFASTYLNEIFSKNQ